MLLETVIASFWIKGSMEIVMFSETFFLFLFYHFISIIINSKNIFLSSNARIVYIE